MTFDFFNDIFNINTGVKLSNGSFTFNWQSLTTMVLEPKYLKDSDGLYLITSDNLKLMVRG